MFQSNGPQIMANMNKDYDKFNKIKDQSYFIYSAWK